MQITQPLIIEFIQFINQQPKEEVIEHGSWSSCAVGKFMESKNWSVYRFDKTYGSIKSKEFECFKIQLLHDFPESSIFDEINLHSILNFNGHILDEDDRLELTISTYGDLQNFIVERDYIISQ